MADPEDLGEGAPAQEAVLHSLEEVHPSLRQHRLRSHATCVSKGLRHGRRGRCAPQGPRARHLWRGDRRRQRDPTSAYHKLRRLPPDGGAKVAAHADHLQRPLWRRMRPGIAGCLVVAWCKSAVEVRWQGYPRLPGAKRRAGLGRRQGDDGKLQPGQRLHEVAARGSDVLLVPPGSEQRWHRAVQVVLRPHGLAQHRTRLLHRRNARDQSPGRRCARRCACGAQQGCRRKNWTRAPGLRGGHPR
mmetsp:Transcript_114295/g.330157  ORF Transcript_114295/g.330157 Transcript_114295/m.330157 type:complete len:244 (-) Transcript_114295:382-1113(-)